MAQSHASYLQSLLAPFSTSQVSIARDRSHKFMRDIAELFNDKKYSDATVRIHNVALPVHKSVICLQSPYFEKAFKNTFIEGSSGVLEFKDGSGAAYWSVFEYLYTGDYSDTPSGNFEDDPPLLKDPRVYGLADMFFLEDLKKLCMAKLKRKLQNLWTSDSFPDCVREVYANTLDSNLAMRSVVVEVARAHTLELGRKSNFRDLLREGGDFVVEYIESIGPPAPPPSFGIPAGFAASTMNRRDPEDGEQDLILD